MTGNSRERSFRRAVPGESALLFQLEQQIGAAGWSSTQFAGELINPVSETWLFEENGVPAGYGVIHNCAGEGELLLIGLLPAVRGCGNGTQLLELLLDRCRAAGSERVFLEVRRSNHTARRFYAAHGFSECGVRIGYYAAAEDGTAEDAVLYSYCLV